MAAPVSKAEYLKKYLSGPKTEEKTVKKKKLRPVLKSKSKGRGMRIVDEDVDLDQIRRGSDDDEQILGTREEAPQVFAVVDERPIELRVKEDYATNPKWKRVAPTDASDESRLKNKNVSGKAKHLSRSRHDSGSDISPLRPSCKRHDSGSDLSPPRPSRKRHDSGSDLSPPRPSRKRHDSGSDLSPPRPSRKRHDSGSDLSPPRPSRKRHDSDASPPRRQQSPSSDLSPPRAKKQAGKSYESDQSPPRKCMDSDGDQSPPRRRRDSDRSPPRKRVDPDGDQSPPRKQRDSDSDRSPLRRKQPSPDRSPKRKTKNDDAGDGKVESSSKMSKTLEGKKAGLQSARLLREETEEFRKRENEAFKHLSKEITGAGATTNVRAGKRRELELKAEKEREKEEKRKELEKIFSKWNKGVKQLEERKQRVEDDVYEMSKPLARYEGDEDLEKMLRDQDREGDPMAKYMAKKKAKSQNEPNKPRYQGPPPPPNRFGIMPGFRWDGVDRSNGFEKKLFERKNSSKALEEEAYKWSVSDM